MSREIKFRAWNQKFKYMTAVFDFHDIKEGFTGWMDAEVMQFTGQSVGGEQIWEGDVLEIKHDSGDTARTQVRFYDGGEEIVQVTKFDLLDFTLQKTSKQIGAEANSLFIKELRVDKGIVMKRMMPAAMGSGHRINKRTSHVTLVLEEKEGKKEKNPRPKSGSRPKSVGEK